MKENFHLHKKKEAHWLKCSVFSVFPVLSWLSQLLSLTSPPFYYRCKILSHVTAAATLDSWLHNTVNRLEIACMAIRGVWMGNKDAFHTFKWCFLVLWHSYTHSHQAAAQYNYSFLPALKSANALHGETSVEWHLSCCLFIQMIDWGL